uniref:Leucine-rich repeat-containing N-terminal plant-type domain-containing protein n=1 Tax=Leersia perrieri TaxID=77586 RepID=A0A0D9XTC8_9ORYZ
MRTRTNYQHLFLQNNFLNGNIPISLTHLKGLDTLDLSGNNICQIPKSLGDMPLLNSLNLSFNSFGREMPTNGAFANASEIYVQGNADLCGGIPELHLPPCSLKSTRKQKTSHSAASYCYLSRTCRLFITLHASNLS